MCSANASDILPEPPEELKHLSAELADLIREKIARHGPMPFSQYMEMALYEPGLGYYSAGLQKFGAGGDFVTAPQLGDVFARCLSRQVAQVAAVGPDSGSPSPGRLHYGTGLARRLGPVDN